MGAIDQNLIRAANGSSVVPKCHPPGRPSTTNFAVLIRPESRLARNPQFYPSSNRTSLKILNFTPHRIGRAPESSIIPLIESNEPQNPQFYPSSERTSLRILNFTPHPNERAPESSILPIIESNEPQNCQFYPARAPFPSEIPHFMKKHASLTPKP